MACMASPTHSAPLYMALQQENWTIELAWCPELRERERECLRLGLKSPRTSLLSYFIARMNSPGYSRLKVGKIGSTS